MAARQETIEQFAYRILKTLQTSTPSPLPPTQLAAAEATSPTSQMPVVTATPTPTTVKAPVMAATITQPSSVTPGGARMETILNAAAALSQGPTAQTPSITPGGARMETILNKAQAQGLLIPGTDIPKPVIDTQFGKTTSGAPETTLDLYNWVLSFSIAYILIKQGGAIFGLLGSGIAGIVKLFLLI